MIKFVPKNGSIVRTCVKREPVGRMLSSIHRPDIDQWWERKCDAFIWKEVELRRNLVENTHEAIFYTERSSDQYEIFWVKFPKEFFHWKKRLQESPEFQGQANNICAWDTQTLAALQRLDCPVTRVVDFWVSTMLEGYIIEFAAENHQYFSWAEEIFKKGVRGRILREIPLWIKVFLIEEGMLIMSLTEIAA
jgi:hypothetical protein